jgi:hypothetical protein
VKVRTERKKREGGGKWRKVKGEGKGDKKKIKVEETQKELN